MSAGTTAIQVVLHDGLDFFASTGETTLLTEAKVGESRTAKDLVESCGVPHPEILRLEVDGQAADFETRVNGGEQVDVYGWTTTIDITQESYLGRPLVAEPRFVADVHLGRLVRYLRMLGLDCLYEPPWDDDILAETSHREQRVMLTRDIGLLKRKVVIYGMFLRSDQAEEQARELLARFNLEPFLESMTRCAACNGTLVEADKANVADRLPEGTRRSYDEFYECQSCQKVYWKGAHFSGLSDILQNIRA